MAYVTVVIKFYGLISTNYLKRSDFTKFCNFRSSGHLRDAHGFEDGEPILALARLLAGQVGDGGQAGQGAFDELEAKSFIEKTLVDLVEEGPVQVDQALGFRSLGMVEE